MSDQEYKNMNIVTVTVCIYSYSFDKTDDGLPGRNMLLKLTLE